MKKKTYQFQLIFILVFQIGLQAMSQGQTQEIPPWNRSPIKGQFDYLIFKSTQETDYRLVNQNWLFILKSRVLDTIKTYKQDVIELKKISAHQRKEVDSLKLLLTSVNGNFAKVSKEKESITFLGIRMKKSSYKTLAWTITSILIISLLIFIVLFQRSNIVTVQTKNSYEELKQEFDAFRKRSLHREEEQARKYLNELNKYKK